MIRTTPESGFVALMSVIITSAILLIMVYTILTSSFFARFDALDGENKLVSYQLAEGCVNSAIIAISLGNGTTGCVSLGGVCGGADPQRVCRVCSITPVGNITTITTRARYNGAFTNLTVSFDTSASNYPITGWSETSSGDSSCTVP